jgi:hypothetical protein
MRLTATRLEAEPILRSNGTKCRREDAILNYLSITLSVTSEDLDPQAITQRLGIIPTSTRVRGTPIGKTGLMRQPQFDYHEWMLRRQCDLPAGAIVEDLQKAFIDDFFESFAGASKQICALSASHTVLVALVYRMDRMPYIGLTASQVQTIAGMGAGVDYDLMLDGL